MIDGIKILLGPQYAQRIRSRFEVKQILNTTTGELGDNWYAKEGVFHFTYKYPKYLTLRFSLPKFAHGVNHTDFGYSECVLVIYQLCEILGKELLECRVLRVEFGVNIKMPFSFDFLEPRLLFYKRKTFLSLSKEGLGRVVKLSDYTVKLYDKSKQYNLKSNVIRWEIAVNRISWLRKDLLIKDLLDQDFILTLKDRLLEAWDHVEIAESDEIMTLPESQQQLIQDWYNPLFTASLKVTNPKEFARQYKRYRRVSRTIKSCERIKNQVLKAINDKCDELLAS